MGVRRLIRDKAIFRLNRGKWFACPICGKKSPTYRSDRYGEATDHCLACHSHRRKRYLAQAVKIDAARVPEFLRILEIAPGGQLSAMLQRRFRGYVGLRYPPFSADDLPFRDAQFDIVVSCDVIEHFIDPIAALNEINRVLSPGGVHLSAVLVDVHPTFFGSGAVLGAHVDEDGGTCPVYTNLGFDLHHVVSGWVNGSRASMFSGVLRVEKPQALGGTNC